MQCILILPPLAAIEIIRVLRKPGCLCNTKITAVRHCAAAAYRACSCAVPWGWLTQIIESGPDKFSCHKIPCQSIVHGVVSSKTPAYRRRIIRGKMIFAVCIGKTTLRQINSSAVYCGRSLCPYHDAVCIAEAVIIAAAGIVKARHTACSRHFLNDLGHCRIPGFCIIAGSGWMGAIFLL